MIRKLMSLIVALGLVLWAGTGFAVEGAVRTLAEAKAKVQQQPDKHILVFYKNYAS